MRINFAIAAGALALGLATWMTPVNAQGPLYDRVNVSLPYTVTIGDHTLQPGDYVIQQLRTQSGGGRVLLIYSDKGMKFETTAMTIPALDVNTPDNTKVVLHHFGTDYYFDKIWIQGKDYGYEFPLPNNVKQRESERQQVVSVPANYQAMPEDTTSSTLPAPSVTPVPAPSVTPAPAATTTEPSASASQTTPPAAEPQPTVDTGNQAAPTASTAPAAMPPSTMDNNSADRSMETSGSGNAGNTGSSSRSMPNTSAGWLMMMLGGGTLSGAGLMLRRKR
jgi:hypothetical protein